MQYEVKEGRLYIDELPLPLGRGLVILALLKAGWNGVDGVLPLEVIARLPIVDPRVSLFTRPQHKAG